MLPSISSISMAESVKGVLQPNTFGFKWTIKNFFADCKIVGDFYKSPAFPVHYPDKVTKWYLRVFPKGENDESNNSISVYLCYESENVSEVTVDYQLSVVSEHISLSKIHEAKTFKSPVDNWGWKRFLTQDIIKNTNSGALVDDTLTILCEMTFLPTDQAVTEKLNVYANLLDESGWGHDDYENLLESNYFTDVTFDVQNKQIFLHKAILMCRNPVFKAMFEHDMREKKESFVIVEDVEYEVMMELFRFIYSGKVENVKRIAKDLLVAADKYCVAELKVLCEKVLYDNLTIDNVVQYLNLTDMCVTVHLKALTINFAAAHFKDVLNEPGFANLSSNVMFQIIQAIAEKDG